MLNIFAIDPAKLIKSSEQPNSEGKSISKLAHND